MSTANALKSALAIHHTATSDAAWDGPANEARIPNDAGAATLRRAYAWIDPDADPDTKAAYKFIHHEVSADGSIGAASVVACSTGIGVLNGGRTGTTIPEADRAGVAAHLNAHLRDAGRDAVTLKSAASAESDEPLARAIKFVGPDLIEGPAFLFNPDITGEQFTPETDLCIEWFGKSGRPLLYEHGLDGAMKAGLIGRQTDYEIRDEGVWAQAQLDRSKRYRKAIDSLIDERALAYSGGAMAHLATKSAAGAIKRFPWVELSLTPTPANPANASVYYLKSLDAVAHLEAADVELPDPLKAALTALDEWADSRDATPVPERLADRLDRVSTELEGLHEHVREYSAMRVKSGRSLSAKTRGRLTVHPASLRELAEALDELLADANKSTPDFTQLLIESQALTARALGVELPSMETH